MQNNIKIGIGIVPRLVHLNALLISGNVFKDKESIDFLV
jgi:hypothetical protein